MSDAKESALFPVSVLFCFMFAVTLLINSAGHYLDISLARVSLPLAAIPCFIIIYGYFFPPTLRNFRALIVAIIMLAALGLASAHLLDLTSDGLGYQQPSSEAILNGWNPLHPAKMLWQNIYPSGAWELEAALSSLYGSIESGKMLQFWWLFIALSIFPEGMRHHKGRALTRAEKCLSLLTVICPVVLCQLFTYYVDSLLYLSGITFLGTLFMYGEPRKQKTLSLALMGCCILFIVNVKLSGIYHAVILCLSAMAYIWITSQRLPVKEGLFLLSAGLVAVLFLGYHPYITNLVMSGSLMPLDSETFSGAQRPLNLRLMPGFQRFFYSLFSVTGGGPQELAHLKWPWEIRGAEWWEAGAPDSRTGGFGVWFAFASISACAIASAIYAKTRTIDLRLVAVGGILFTSSFLFPEGWWARYVPFAYTSVILLLLALPSPAKLWMRLGLYGVILLLCFNSLVAAIMSDVYYIRAQSGFMAAVHYLRSLPEETVVYLVPPNEEYEKYNQSYRPLQRRLAMYGIESKLMLGAPCRQIVLRISEYTICYCP